MVTEQETSTIHIKHLSPLTSSHRVTINNVGHRGGNFPECEFQSKVINQTQPRKEH